MVFVFQRSPIELKFSFEGVVGVKIILHFVYNPYLHFANVNLKTDSMINFGDSLEVLAKNLSSFECHTVKQLARFQWNEI